MSKPSVHPSFDAAVVDADEDRRDRIIEVLMKQGFHVPVANAELSAEPEVNIDLFVLVGADRRIEDCRRIRSLSAHANTMVLMLTPRNDAQTIEAAYDAGATETLPLPVVWSAFARRVSHVQEFLRARQLTAESRARRETFLRAVPDMIMLVDRDGNNLAPLMDYDGAA
ncbi:MAG: hypothetical protein AAGA61_08030, partial [Pseudomonadota bacterium]